MSRVIENVFAYAQTTLLHIVRASIVAHSATIDGREDRMTKVLFGLLLYVLTIFLLAPRGAHAQGRIYARIPGVAGPVGRTASGSGTGWIAVDATSSSVERAADGPVNAAASFADITLRKEVDKTSPILFQYVALAPA